MLKRLLTIVAILFLLGFSNPSTASLVVEDLGGTKLTHDTATDLYWWWDMSSFTGLNYSQQISSIASIDVEGFDSFHMATHDEMVELWKYSAESLVSSFKASHTWSTVELIDGRYDAWAAENSHYLTWALVSNGSYSKKDLNSYSMNDINSQFDRGAWAVTTKSTAPVPIPAAAWLLGSALVGLFGLRRRYQR